MLCSKWANDDAQEATKELYKKLWMRNHITQTLASYIPGLHTQQTMNELSRAGLQNQLLFLDSTARFHEKMRLHFYPKIFDQQPVSQENWAAFEVNFFRETTKTDWVRLLLPLFLFIVLIYGLTYVNFKRKPLNQIV